MQKHSVPAAPLPVWAKTTPAPPQAGVEKSGSKRTPASALLPPLDAGFLRGVYMSLLWFGALLTLLVGVATLSLLVAWSFAAGIALAAALLKTQEFFAHHLVQQAEVRRANQKILTGRQVRLPMYALSGAKYLVVAALLGLLLSNGWLWPIPFALGFTTLQVVIVGKALGHILKGRMRPLREVYVRPRRSTLS